MRRVSEPQPHSPDAETDLQASRVQKRGNLLKKEGDFRLVPPAVYKMHARRKQIAVQPVSRRTGPTRRLILLRLSSHTDTSEAPDPPSTNPASAVLAQANADSVSNVLFRVSQPPSLPPSLPPDKSFSLFISVR